MPLQLFRQFRCLACQASIFALALAPLLATAAPNGTWLSQPQIWYYSSTNRMGELMARIRAVRYRVVFLDYRKVSDATQQQVAREARQQ